MSVTISVEDVDFDGELVCSTKQQEILDVLDVQLRENVNLRFIILPGTS